MTGLKKKIGITEVVLRDAHQSLLATRMRTEDMLAIASMLDRVGYWSVECWGGATFDTCIRFLREDPWVRIKKLKGAMPNTPLQMLLRGQNLLGYRHYGDDVVDEFVERAAENGVDVFRVFDALNDVRNLSRAIMAVKTTGKHAQGTISYTTSPFHTIELFVAMGKELENMGCDSICIKDMAGLITPSAAYDLVSGLKKTVNVPISLHSHATTGMATTALYSAISAGCDMVDTSISSLSLGTSHAPTESVVAILQGGKNDTELKLDLLNEIAEDCRRIRKNYAEFESSFAAVDTRILISQVPGGMLTNLESQLKQQNALSKMNDVMNEIPRVRKELGYPPLVTPTSQIVGTQAVLNVLQGERYKTITAETKALLGGHYGKTPAPVDPAIQKKALGDEKPITCRPADLIPPELEKLKKEISGKTKTIEDVLTYALFPQIAPEFFAVREKGGAPVQSGKSYQKPAGDKSKTGAEQRVRKGSYTVTIDGVAYNVMVEEGEGGVTSVVEATKTHAVAQGVMKEVGVKVVDAPLAGRVIKFLKKPGDKIAKSETVLVIEAMKMETEINAPDPGTLERYFVSEGSDFAHGQPLYAVRT